MYNYLNAHGLGVEGIEDGDEVRAEETVGERGTAEGIDRTVIEECYGIAQNPDAVGEVAIIKTVEQLLRAFVYTHAVPIIMKTIENTGQSGRNPDVEELEAAKSRFHETCAVIGKIYQEVRDAGKRYASEAVQMRNDDAERHRLSTMLLRDPEEPSTILDGVVTRDPRDQTCVTREEG